MTIKNIIALSLFITLIWNVDTIIYYGIFLTVVGLIFSRILFLGKVSLLKSGKYDLIPAMFLLVWFYGLIVALYFDNNTEYIVRNNAGMLFYLCYYMLLYGKFSKEQVFKLGYYASIINTVVATALAVLYLGFSVDVYNDPMMNAIFGELKGGASTGQERIFFGGLTSIFVIFAVSLTYLFARKNNEQIKIPWIYSEKRAMFFLIVSIFTTVFVAASKGFVLGAVFLFIAIPLAFLKSISGSKLNKGFIYCVAFLTICIIILIGTDYITIVEAIFNEKDVSNIARYEQLYYLLDDITLVGRGLGGVIPGYARVEEIPFGFELSFVNLFHKFGLVAVVLIIIYLFTMFKATLNLNKKTFDWKYAAAALGAVGFLWPAIGNPTLFAPPNVILHCLAFFLLRKEYNS